MWLLLALLFRLDQASAFPDQIRHGYVNCTACHVSPSGGGMLNAYGRAMSKEVLSAWGGEREPEVMHGLLPEGGFPEWFLVGGDVRAIQVHRESPTRRKGDFMLMQARLDLGVSVGAVTGVVSVGEADPRNDSVREVSPQHYVLWNPQDQLSVRAGRFTPVFGIPMAYHTLPTRAALGFGPGQERHALEVMWSGEVWNLAAAASRTPAGPVPSPARESLFTAQVNRNFLGTHRLGASYLSGSTASVDREALSLHGLFGFSHRWAYLSEFTWSKVQPHSGEATRGLAHFSQLIFEPTRGLQIYFLEDYQKSNFADARSIANSYGPGARFFPRPHFEFDLVFLKKRVAAVADRYDDYAWFLAHYYF